MAKYWLFACALLFSAASAQPPLGVVATTGMVGDVAREVAGDCAQVTTLMGPGVDPHLYRARPSDVRALEQADLILYSGYHLEGQLGEVLAAFRARKPVLALAEEALPESETLLEPDAGTVDPHLWMDVARWARLVPVLAAALSELRPDCAEGVAARADAYALRLAALDTWVRESVTTIPPEQRVLVTAHDAFGYYGSAYGLEVASVQGLSTQAEASLADVRATADLVAERGVPALFVETSINPRTVQAVLEAVRERGGTAVVGGALYSDALGDPGTPEGTYIGMMLHNTEQIVTALGGTPLPLPEPLSD